MLGSILQPEVSTVCFCGESNKREKEKTIKELKERVTQGKTEREDDKMVNIKNNIQKGRK